MIQNNIKHREIFDSGFTKNCQISDASIFSTFRQRRSCETKRDSMPAVGIASHKSSYTDYYQLTLSTEADSGKDLSGLPSLAANIFIPSPDE